jgi:hypothetical protein
MHHGRDWIPGQAPNDETAYFPFPITITIADDGRIIKEKQATG